MHIFQLKSKPHKIERLPLFLKQGFISVGYPGLGSLTDATVEQIEEKLAQAYPEFQGQSLAFHKGMVNAFVNTMQANDIVLIADGDDVHIGKIGQYHYDSDFDNDEEGMCHRRSVEWLSTVQRHYLNDKVQEFLKNRATITKFKYPIEDADLEPFLSGDAKGLAHLQSKAQVYEKAWDVLVKALESEDEKIRVRAAIAILELK